GSGLAIAGCTGAVHSAAGAGTAPIVTGDDDVTPAEDLMREHGVLARLLLVYEEVALRIETRVAVAPEPIARSAALIRRFVEDYHERLEERYLFPRFEQAGVLAALVATLREQHAAGRALTSRIAARAAPPPLPHPPSSAAL